jgi:hypothetical protein
MQESKDRKATAEKNESKELLRERKSEATSKETLSDLEKTEKDLGSLDDESSPGPSPDGQLDETDELKDAGPI